MQPTAGVMYIGFKLIDQLVVTRLELLRTTQVDLLLQRITLAAQLLQRITLAAQLLQLTTLVNKLQLHIRQVNKLQLRIRPLNKQLLRGLQTSTHNVISNTKNTRSFRRSHP